jgi:hypothetical protein
LTVSALPFANGFLRGIADAEARLRLGYPR